MTETEFKKEKREMVVSKKRKKEKREREISITSQCARNQPTNQAGF
jgi:hypothetical protein